jgi:hypothetical protein
VVVSTVGYWKNHQIDVDERGYEDTDETICLDHIDDSFLRAAAGQPMRRTCSICGRNDPDSADAFAVDLQELMPMFMDTFWSFYGRYSEAPSFDGEIIGTEDTLNAVFEVADAAFSREVLDRVSELIAESIGDTEVSTWSTNMDTDDLSTGWDEFARIARHVSRFLVPTSESSRSPLSRVAQFLKALLTYVDGDFNLVETLPVGHKVYRARLVRDARGDLPNTASALGPAPRDKAAANRMSGAGIPMFYGAEDEQLAVTEIAVHGVDPFAVVGTFTCSRPIRILNLTRVGTRPSIFDETHRSEARMLMFLAEFAAQLSRPIVPDGRQHSEYAPTQVLTEYFRWVPDEPLDGIAYGSAHGPGTNYALFVDEVPNSSLNPVPLDFLDSETKLLALTRKVETVRAGMFLGTDWVMSPERFSL